MEFVDGPEAAKMYAPILLMLLALSSTVSAQLTLEDRAKEFLRTFDEQASNLMYSYSLASWAYNTNITQANSDNLVRAETPLLLSVSSLSLIVIGSFCSFLSPKRALFGEPSTVICQSSLEHFPLTKLKTERSNYSSSHSKTKALGYYQKTNKHM